MYDDIVEIYLEIFSLNNAFLNFIQTDLTAPGSWVLDLGCGPGDYINALTMAGYHGVGIDSSRGMIDHAQKTQLGTFYNLSFTEISQLESDQFNRFDCIYCIGNSLSYLPNDRTLDFLGDLTNLMAPSGIFVLQVVNWDKLQHLGMTEFPVKAISKGRSFHRRYEWVKPSVVTFHTEIQSDGKKLNNWSDPLYPKYLESVVDACQFAGLKVIRILGDYDESDFDPICSPALILVAQI
jgi:SAM-dependent methyltransferase